ncbi:MAG: hypothetical protein H6550_15890 [Chitinophagales bacterium]|nr:hypothetical protein [Chitinophagales bacterium]
MVTAVTYGELDRMFEEVLRRAVVAAGYLPDVASYIGDPAGYEAAKASLKTSLGANGRLIEVFGPGPWDNYMDKASCRIVVTREGSAKGTIGGTNEVYFTATSGSGASAVYSKYAYPDATNHVSYSIRVITDSLAYDEIACGIVDKALGNRKYIATVDASGNDTTSKALVCFEGNVDLSSTHFMERMYRYQVKDIFMQPATLISSDIPALTEINPGLYLGNSTDSVDMSGDPDVELSYDTPAP